MPVVMWWVKDEGTGYLLWLSLNILTIFESILLVLQQEYNKFCNVSTLTFLYMNLKPLNYTTYQDTFPKRHNLHFCYLYTYIYPVLVHTKFPRYWDWFRWWAYSWKRLSCKRFTSCLNCSRKYCVADNDCRREDIERRNAWTRHNHGLVPSNNE